VKTLAITLSCLALVAVACSGSPAATEPPTQPPGTAPTQAPTAMPSKAPTGTPVPSTTGGLTITVMQGSLGAYLAGPSGHALYVLTNDSTNTSTCTDSCAQSWPPLLVSAGQNPEPGAGVTGALGTFARADGGTQVTVGGMPVYYFAGDTTANQTNGQGVGGVWFLATPDGTPLGAASSVPSAAPSPATGSASPPASVYIPNY
jgi:predicted lipoprotein with Yx(FWY)xxD motif